MGLTGVVIAEPSPHAAALRERPSALQQIANRPIVGHVIDGLREAGAEQIAIVGCPTDLDQLRRSPEPALQCAQYIPATERTDLLGLLRAAVPFVGQDACVTHAADGLLGEPVAAFRSLLPSGAPDVAVVLHHGGGQPQLDRELQDLLGVSDLRPTRSRLGLARVALFGPGALRSSCQEATPTDSECLQAMLGRISAGGGQLHVGRTSAWSRFTDRPRDLLELNRIVLDRLVPATEMLDCGENRVEGRVEIDPSASIAGSVISGPVIIGPRARITDAYIGPYSSIGADVEIDGAELERSIIGDRAVIRHVNVRIEGSTVGPGARISRDFALPRAMHMHVGAGVELLLND